MAAALARRLAIGKCGISQGTTSDVSRAGLLPLALRRTHSESKQVEERDKYEGLDYDCYGALINLLIARMDIRLDHLFTTLGNDSFHSAFRAAACTCYDHLVVPSCNVEYRALFQTPLAIGKENPQFDHSGPAPGKEWIIRLVPLLNINHFGPSKPALWDKRDRSELQVAIEFAQRMACVAEREVFEASGVDDEMKKEFFRWRDELRRMATNVLYYGGYLGHLDDSFFNSMRVRGGDLQFEQDMDVLGHLYDDCKRNIEEAKRVIAVGGYPSPDDNLLLLAKSQLPFVTRLVDQMTLKL